MTIRSETETHHPDLEGLYEQRVDERGQVRLQG